MKNNKWTKYTIDQLVMICNEKIDSKILNKFNYVSATNLLPNIGGLIPADSIPSSKVTKFKKGDILFSNIRPYFKKLLYATFDGGCSNDVIVFRSKEEIIPKFFYYLISQQYFIDFVTASSKGTKMPRGDKDAIKKFEFYVPSRIIQEKITNILSSLDSKIELNNQINEKLEETAKAIYKEWFVNFNFPDENGLPYKDNGGEFYETELGEIPVGWEVSNIRNISKEIITGKTPSTKKSENYGYDIPFITIPDMRDKTWVVETERYLSKIGAESQRNKTLPKGTICVSCIATPGLVSLTSRDSQTNQQINSIICKDKINIFYVYFYLKSLKDEIINLGSGGTATYNLNKGTFEKISIIIPDENTMLMFNKEINNMFNQILNLQIENVRLNDLKNLLLSKLMSGQIDVDVLNIDWDKLDKTLKEVE